VNDRQKLFVAEYLVDLNATQAAIRAGYSVDTARSIGSENLTKPDIASAIQAEMDKRAERTKVSADYVLNTILDTIERCKQAKPVTYKNGDPVLTETPEGNLAQAYAFDSNAVLKGAELLGKHLKMFTDKSEISGPDGKPIEVTSGLSAETKGLLDQLSGVGSNGSAQAPVPD
jgi:phage terminase small subunit